MQWWCENCGGEGEIFYDDHKTEQPVLVICSHCSFPSAYVWCEKCGMGGQLADTDFSKKPDDWICTHCKSEYQLLASFYEASIFFSPTFLTKEKKKKQKTKLKKNEYVTHNWARKTLLFWKKYRIKVFVWSYLCFFMFVCGMFLVGSFLNNISLQKLILLSLMVLSGLSLLCLVSMVITDTLALIISSSYLLIYKIRKSREI